MKKTIIGVSLLLLAALPGVAVAGKGGNGGSGGGAPATGVITVADAEHAGTTTATVNPGGENVYVFVQCYKPDFGGEYVFAAYYPADANNQALVGPLWSTLWLEGDASCQAQEGYFTRNGFGKWVVAATTTFRVTDTSPG